MMYVTKFYFPKVLQMALLGSFKGMKRGNAPWRWRIHRTDRSLFPFLLQSVMTGATVSEMLQSPLTPTPVF